MQEMPRLVFQSVVRVKREKELATLETHTHAVTPESADTAASETNLADDRSERVCVFGVDLPSVPWMRGLDLQEEEEEEACVQQEEERKSKSGEIKSSERILIRRLRERSDEDFARIDRRFCDKGMRDRRRVSRNRASHDDLTMEHPCVSRGERHTPVRTGGHHQEITLSHVTHTRVYEWRRRRRRRLSGV